MSKISLASRRGAAVTASGIAAVAAAGANSADLVGTLGWDNDAALALAGIFATGGAAAVMAIFPFLAPFLGTLEMVFLFGGTGAFVGF